MSKQKIESIKRYLERDDVRQRIYQGMKKWRSEVAVPIGRASDLFGFSENQLRDWEERDLLHPLREARYHPRSRTSAPNSKLPAIKHRHYSLAELDKLVVIRELLQAQYAPGDIPPNIEEIADIDALRTSLSLPPLPQDEQSEHNDDVLGIPIDIRIKKEIPDQIFWHFYTSHILKMILILISENLPNTDIGLILPLRPGSWLTSLTPRIEDLSTIDEAVVGWLNSNRTFHIMLSQKPSFQSPDDYCLFPLVAIEDGMPLESLRGDTLIVLKQRYNTMMLPYGLVLLIERLITPLYEEGQLIQTCFGASMLNSIEPAPTLEATARNKDTILTGLADMIIRLGGSTKDGSRRWQFCTILLPDLSNGKRSMQQCNLIVRAQSKGGPYIVGEAVVASYKLKAYLGQRAFQSGRMIYRLELSSNDLPLDIAKLEGSVRSNIAVPIGGEYGQTVAVMYIASYTSAAFSYEDQQLLRLIGRMIENYLATSIAHVHETQTVHTIIRTPEIVDSFFAEFLSENDFVRSVEDHLTDIRQQQNEEKQEPGKKQTSVSKRSAQLEKSDDVISFIGLDIDNQENLASKYGDQIMKEMSKTIGQRIQDLIVSFVTRSADCHLYYMFANRYYLILRGISLNKTRQTAEQLRRNLEGNISIKQSNTFDSILIIPAISVHLAVSSYPFTKLHEFVDIYPFVADISSKIIHELDAMLKMGVDEHGNVVMSFDPETKSYIRWSGLTR
jgi:hypothetical protein